MSVNFINALALRTEFEDLTTEFNMPVTGSSINTLKWFAENGFRSNRLRNGYDRAMEIANILLEHYENDRGNKEGPDS